MKRRVRGQSSGWHARAAAIWHNFWDTELTYEKSYLARLNYVHQNAVKHGLVARACQYRWCSAAWFERTVSAGTSENDLRLQDRSLENRG